MAFHRYFQHRHRSNAGFHTFCYHSIAANEDGEKSNRSCIIRRSAHVSDSISTPLCFGVPGTSADRWFHSDVAVAVVQIVYAPLLNLADPSLELWPWILILQVMQCTSIVTSCLPYLRQLVEIIPSGMYTSDEIRRRVATGSRAGRSHGKQSQWSALRSSKRSRAAVNRVIQLSNLSRINAEHVATVTSHLNQDMEDTGSYHSESRILKSMTFGTTSRNAGSISATAEG